jgi:hypothetical protein
MLEAPAGRPHGSGRLSDDEMISGADCDDQVRATYLHMKDLMIFSPDEHRHYSRIPVCEDAPFSPCLKRNLSATLSEAATAFGESFNRRRAGVLYGGEPDSSSRESSICSRGTLLSLDLDSEASPTRSGSGERTMPGLRSELLAAQQRVRELEQMLAEARAENLQLRDARTWGFDVRESPELVARCHLRSGDASAGATVSRGSARRAFDYSGMSVTL